MTDQELKQLREEMLASMSEEKRQAYLEAEAAHDRLVAIALSEHLGVNIELIPNDPDHVRVGDQVMGYNEFSAYCQERIFGSSEETPAELN